MRLKSVRIRNFRSFKDELVQLDPYTCLVGPNGAGKSTVLCALNIFFREVNNAATDLTTLHEEDFFNKNTEEAVEITVEFCDLSDEAKQELSDYVRHDSLFVTSKATFDSATKSAPVRQYGQRLAMPELAPFFQAYGDNATAAALKSIYVALRTTFPDLPPPGTKDSMKDNLLEYERARTERCVLIPREPLNKSGFHR